MDIETAVAATPPHVEVDAPEGARRGRRRSSRRPRGRGGGELRGSRTLERAADGSRQEVSKRANAARSANPTDLARSHIAARAGGVLTCGDRRRGTSPCFPSLPSCASLCPLDRRTHSCPADRIGAWLTHTGSGSSTASPEAQDRTPPVWRRDCSRTTNTISQQSRSSPATTAYSTSMSTAGLCSRSR